MGQQYADVCDRCIRTVVKADTADSSDMLVVNLELLYLSDEYLPGKTSRPSLNITDGRYCLDCFLNMIGSWVRELEALKRSEMSEVVQKADG